MNDEATDFLEHFGIKGMHWGVRKSALPGVSHKTNKDARKDAEEFARAKLFYGKGAGTRRKLIKNTVEAKAKKDPSYKKAFDHHLENQDLSVHATKARTERGRVDRRERGRQRAGYVARRLTGEMGTQAAFTAAAIAGAAFLNSGRGRAMLQQGMTTVRSQAARHRMSEGARQVDDIFRNMNFR